MLVARDRERHAIELAFSRARSGDSAILMLVGEPGIGKTELLEHAAGRAEGMRLLRARGVQSEAQVAFASLLELLHPALALVEQIPPPQAAALQGALALRPATAQDRFAVGAATLSLLAAYAEQAPLAVLIDDAHWLDVPSAQALLFACRRLLADPIAVLIAARENEPSPLSEADLPTLRIGGLSAVEARALLPTVSGEAALRLHQATAGNPLALLELGSQADELAFAPASPPVLVSERVSRAFLRRSGELDPTAHRALVLAAACENGDLVILERAAAVLGVDLSALALAEAAGLVAIRPGRVEFRHPLARSAIYSHAPASLRRAAHRALAAALPDRELDRRAWHLASAAAGVDESASAALAQAGARAADRSGYAAAAGAFERAARLTASAERRTRLLVQAAEAGWHAGRPDRAAALLDEARAGTSDADALVEIDELSGRIASRQGPLLRGYPILTEAASRSDSERAVAMLAEAAATAFYAGNPNHMLAAAHPHAGGARAGDGRDGGRGRRRRRGGDPRGDRARGGLTGAAPGPAAAPVAGGGSALPARVGLRPCAAGALADPRPRAGGGGRAALRAQPGGLGPGDDRALVAGGGNLRRGDRPRPRSQPAHGFGLRPRGPRPAARPPGPRAAVPLGGGGRAGALRAAGDAAARGLVDRGARNP